MPYWVYIIQSQSTGRFYCGYSSDPQRRLRQHNDPEYQLSKTTKRFKGDRGKKFEPATPLSATPFWFPISRKGCSPTEGSAPVSNGHWMPGWKSILSMTGTVACSPPLFADMWWKVRGKVRGKPKSKSWLFYENCPLRQFLN